MNKFPELWLVLGAMLAAAAGCGGEVGGTISGTVRAGERPLPSGSVVFEENGTVVIGSISNGVYTARIEEGTPLPGTYRVSIIPPPVETIADRQTTQLRAATTVEEALFPLRYRNADTSGLTCVVQPGANTFNISMH
jgi:hypothetical protein